VTVYLIFNCHNKLTVCWR